MAHTPTPNGTARWQLLVSIISLAVFVGAASIGFFVKIGIMASDLEITQSKVAALESQMLNANRQIATNDIAITRLQTQSTEIETQFCAADTVRNLTHAHDMRIQSMMWGKVFGSPLPTDNAFYPRIGRCATAQ
jgi:hypothetical protein